MVTATSLEQGSIFTPLGIRFWDLVFNRQISNDLMVTARPETSTSAVVPAFRTRTGIYAFQGLPGLQDFEYPLDEPILESSPPNTLPFIIEIADRRQRFLPVAFGQRLPLPYSGVFPSTAISSPPNEPGSPPDASPPGFYLFSAATRPVSPGLAVVRVQLEDQTTGQPAAHAIFEVQIGDDEIWWGIADDQGTTVVMFPYPTFTVTLETSPPGGLAPSQQEWPVTISVRYAPHMLEYLTPVTLPNLSIIPEFRTILNQSSGFIHPTTSGADPPVETWPETLIFGQNLIVRSSGLSALLVSPAT